MSRIFFLAAVGTIATIGFAVLFQVSPKKLPAIAAGTFITCLLELILEIQVEMTLFTANLVAALVASLLAEFLARRLRAPATVFYLPFIIPLVPGRGLYLTMSNLLQGNFQSAQTTFFDTAKTGLGISAGIVLASVINIYFRILQKKIFKKTGRS